MIQQNVVLKFAQNRLGLMLKIQQELVFLGVQIKHSEKITQGNVLKIALIGVPMLIIQQLFVLKIAQLILLRIT